MLPRSGFVQQLIDAIQLSAYEVVFTHPYSGATLADLVPVSSVSVNPSQLTLSALTSGLLVPVIAPSTAGNKRVEWFSGNTAVAIVDQTGFVTALSAGTASITVRTVDGAKIGTCNVTVTGAPATTSVAGELSSWELNLSNGARTRTATAHANGVSTAGGSLIAALGSGLDPTRDINNGLYGYGLEATTVTDAFGYQEYISFAVAPEPGKLLTITKLTIAPYSQNAPAHFTLYSNIKGFFPDKSITTFTSDAPPASITISGHSNLPTLVEFRIYVHRTPGVEGGMVGVGWHDDGADAIIEGSVQTISGDNTAPTVPANLASTPITSGQTTLTWQASTDNVAVRGYYVYKNGVKVNGLPVAAQYLIVTELTEGTSYSFKVAAIDYAGNESAQSTAYTLSGNKPPVAVLNATPKTGNSPLTVSFNAAGSTDPDAGDFILGYEWDFGDGSVKSIANAPTHLYATNGTYTVSLRVMDNRNMYSAAATTVIRVGTTSVARRIARGVASDMNDVSFWRLDGRRMPATYSQHKSGNATVKLIRKDRSGGVGVVELGK